MANLNQQQQDLKRKQNEIQQELYNNQQRIQRGCDHKPHGGSGRVRSIKDENVPIRNKDQYSDTTAYCDNCRAIFESETYSKQELESAMYMFASMLEQTKLAANLSDEDYQTIFQGYDALDILSKIVVYYNDMVKKLTNGKGNSGKRRESKGSIGLDVGMFGARY